MLIERRIGSLIITALIISGSLTSCGGETQLSTVSPQQINQVSPEDLTKIMSRLDEISSKIDKLETVKATNSTEIPQVANNTISTAKTTGTVSTSAKTTTAITATKTATATIAEIKTPTPASTSTTADPKVRGRKILDTIANTITSAAGIEAEVNKYEKNLDTGKTLNHTLKLYTSKAGQVRIDVLYASSGSSGVKLLYTSGVGDKVKVRPSGVLSLVTTDLDKTDDRIVSSNGYLADDTDFYGMARRFSKPDYEAELIGTSKMNNESVYILNVTCKSKNTLDSRIKYEHIAFEPKTFSIRSWEAYDGSSKDAFYKYDLKYFTILSTMPDSNFKI